MQRIDRELNASLDIDRAMRITLDWAMRQSKAEAGLVGTVEVEGIQVMTAQGYTDELEQPTRRMNGKWRIADQLPGSGRMRSTAGSRNAWTR